MEHNGSLHNLPCFHTQRHCMNCLKFTQNKMEYRPVSGSGLTCGIACIHAESKCTIFKNEKMQGIKKSVFHFQ
jgi:hypothetical protein